MANTLRLYDANAGSEGDETGGAAGQGYFGHWSVMIAPFSMGGATTFSEYDFVVEDPSDTTYVYWFWMSTFSSVPVSTWEAGFSFDSDTPSSSAPGTMHHFGSMRVTKTEYATRTGVTYPNSVAYSGFPWAPIEIVMSTVIDGASDPAWFGRRGAPAATATPTYNPTVIDTTFESPNVSVVPFPHVVPITSTRVVVVAYSESRNFDASTPLLTGVYASKFPGVRLYLLAVGDGDPTLLDTVTINVPSSSSLASDECQEHRVDDTRGVIMYPYAELYPPTLATPSEAMRVRMFSIAGDVITLGNEVRLGTPGALRQRGFCDPNLAVFSDGVTMLATHAEGALPAFGAIQDENHYIDKLTYTGTTLTNVSSTSIGSIESGSMVSGRWGSDVALHYLDPTLDSDPPSDATVDVYDPSLSLVATGTIPYSSTGPTYAVQDRFQALNDTYAHWLLRAFPSDPYAVTMGRTAVFKRSGGTVTLDHIDDAGVAVNLFEPQGAYWVDPSMPDNPDGAFAAYDDVGERSADNDNPIGWFRIDRRDVGISYDPITGVPTTTYLWTTHVVDGPTFRAMGDDVEPDAGTAAAYTTQRALLAFVRDDYINDTAELIVMPFDRYDCSPRGMLALTAMDPRLVRSKYQVTYEVGTFPVVARAEDCDHRHAHGLDCIVTSIRPALGRRQT